MKVQLGKQTGLALALLSTLLATLFAMGVFSVAQAQQTSSTATRSFSATTVAPGGEVVVTIEVNAQAGGIVKETLPAGFSYVSSTHIFVGEKDGRREFIIGQAATTSFTYTVTASDVAGAHTFEGEFEERGGAVVSVGGDSTVTVVAATEGNGETDDGQVELSTDKAGAAVSITVNATAGTDILGGRDIKVTLADFGVPSAIDTDDVILDGKERGSYYGNPADVSVSGSAITITLPTRVPGTSGETARISGDYSIYFKTSAGITNPAYADADGAAVTVTDADGDEKSNTPAIVVTASVKPSFVTRGGDATVTAKGLRDGTTTVYLVDEDDGRGAALGTGTADDGVVEIEIDTSGSALVANATADGDKDVGVNALRVIDSNDGQVGDDFMLGIKPTVKLTSATAKRSADMEISVSDWYYGDINKVTVAGISVGDVDEDVDDGKAKFKVTVPGNVRTGDQEVKVYGDNPGELNTSSATATVNIVVLALDVSPSTVVPGQRVTITGSGFANSEDVSSIMIGGKPVTPPGDADSTSSGRVAVTVTVPLDVGSGDKKVELTVDTRTGEGEITISKPSIELDPATSVPGSVISVNGSGFASSGRVEVMYDGAIEEVGRADSSGDFSIRLEIPSDAGVGATNPVKVETRGTTSINASADHKTPGSAITVPEQAQVGTLITISGSNFEPFSTLDVMIGGRDATPTPGPETDKNGAFEVEARVPRLSAGSHTITIKDGSPEENSVTETFEVITTPVVSTPAEVFGGLGANLVVVWHYDNTTASWSSYSPANPAELNDLTGVSRGNIVWLQLNEAAVFQGESLRAGWSLITLE